MRNLCQLFRVPLTSDCLKLRRATMTRSGSIFAHSLPSKGRSPFCTVLSDTSTADYDSLSPLLCFHLTVELILADHDSRHRRSTLRLLLLLWCAPSSSTPRSSFVKLRRSSS